MLGLCYFCLMFACWWCLVLFRVFACRICMVVCWYCMVYFV